MPKPTSQRGYPLAALFVLIAVCAVLTAMLGPVVRAAFMGNVSPNDLAAVLFPPAIFLAVIGACVGLHHHRRWKGMGLGAATGGSVGFLIGPLLVTPSVSFPNLIAAALGGSAALLLIGVVVRLSTRERE